ncbi:MAG TPA: FAD-dependent oxidoreductase, partial [Gammaproteobacteria bacterium]|nr:FAD-dependent oxidoreductase [Gammaproteobacteria bacterium]
MTNSLSADAVVIGAGIIGTAVAYELAKRGQRTISVDRAPKAGYGSTSSSCAIIRVHYSTLEGTAFAFDAYHDWEDWSGYLGAASAKDLDEARFHKTGCLVMKTEGNGHLTKILDNARSLAIPYEEWNEDEITRRLPGYDLRCYAPAKRMEDPSFGEPESGRIEGGVFFPTAGYISDPQLASQNIQSAAEAAG